MQILVGVVSIRFGLLKTDDGKVSMRTVIGRVLAGPKRLVRTWENWMNFRSPRKGNKARFLCQAVDKTNGNSI